MRRLLPVLLVLVAAAPAAAAPRVPMMVVGRGGKMLFAPRSVVARAVTLRVGHHRCRVAAGTPLAALAAARRAHGPRFRVTDSGSCGATLFVTSVAGQRNSGQAGWVYKVGHREGTAGAGNPSGPFGSGRVRSGVPVLWFWCRQATRCQRALSSRPAARRVRSGRRLRVRVVGYDPFGRARAIRGAVVHLGRASARTGRNGVAYVRARGRGRERLFASRRGLVRSFPIGILVR